MESKKTTRANLENKRGLFILIGLAVAFSVVFLAINLTNEVAAVKMHDQPTTEPGSDVIIDKPVKTEKTVPPPKFLLTNTLIISDDPGIIDEPEIEPSEAYTGMLIDALPSLPPDENPDEDVDIFEVVEQKPEFPGGEQVLLRWIAKNIKYPSIAIENEIQGIVFVNFVVDRDGGISNARVLRSVDPLLDEEALRVVKLLPKWEPGKQRGKPVRVSYTIPIHFRLQQS
jgi:protein TonB